MSRLLTYVEAIREAMDQCMARDSSVFVMGLGATYENGCDGTTAGLVTQYPGRVFDTPCSENATTGFCVGAAVAGMRPVIYHGRVEFALFAYDQIVTQAAKWNYMFGGNSPVPLVIRIAVGRRWGDAPQHTAVLHSVFAHVPGLKVVIPSTPRMAKGLLIAAIKDNNPVVFLEHRWLYGIKQSVPTAPYQYPLGTSQVVRQGKDITIVANADTLLEVLRCMGFLECLNIAPEVIDLVSINPLDYKTIITSVEKTGRLIVLDVGTKAFGVGSEVVAHVCEKLHYRLLAPPINIAAPDCPCPMSTALSARYYPLGDMIIERIASVFGKTIEFAASNNFNQLHMPPGDNMDKLL